MHHLWYIVSITSKQPVTDSLGGARAYENQGRVLKRELRRGVLATKRRVKTSLMDKLTYQDKRQMLTPRRGDAIVGDTTILASHSVVQV